MPIRIEKYSSDLKLVWDNFVKDSKNATFLFYRDYMEYHADRFKDLSLLFYDEEELIAILPANIKNNTIITHGGLTYGGFLSNKRMTAKKMLDIFSELINFLKDISVNNLRYKPIPYIYHSIPSEEDLYSLFINNATLVRRDVASTIYLPNKLSFSKGRKCSISKAKKANVEVKQTNDFNSFIAIETALLQEKYGVKPVHTSEEISLLAERFPENIKLFGAFLEGNMIGGIITYINKETIHCQYIAANEICKEIGGVDLVASYLISDLYKNKLYFDFGISTEQDGRFLNTGLISQKEMFGARSIVYDVYEMEIK